MKNKLVMLFGFLVFSQVLLSAESSVSELSRVREALAEAALEKGVSVVSSAYIDGDGELVESSFYRSGATLRGIRMPQYFQADPYDAQILFSDTALNVDLSCQELSPHKYRKAISIDTAEMLSGSETDQRFFETLASLRSEVKMSAISAIADNDEYYILPTSDVELVREDQYYAALKPRANFADPRNTNLIIKAQIVNVETVRYTPGTLYERGKTEASRLQKFVTNGFKSTLAPHEKRESSSQSSFDFELLLTILRSSLLGSSDEVIAEESLRLRFDREENTIELKEPLLDRVTGIMSTIGQQNLSPSEAPANARDLFMVTEAIRSILTTSIDQIRCEVEMLKTYSAQESDNTQLILNHGIVAGINIGDRFLLSESDFISGINPISSNQLENLAIAEVTQASEYSSVVRIIEGPQQDLYSLSAIPF